MDKDFDVVNREDVEKLRNFCGGKCRAVINGLGTQIYITAYFDEDYYLESGVHIYGNNGHYTCFDNAYHWKKGKKTPYRNPGWMIMGDLILSDEAVSWYPNDYNEPLEDDLELYSDDEFYRGLTLQRMFNVTRKFILNDRVHIEAKLDELGIKYPNGIYLSNADVIF
jgi:hypothetical protein